MVVRSLTEAEAETTGSTHGGQYEITVIETHTPDAPFIFESLKNFLMREGLRVLSADPLHLQREAAVGDGSRRSAVRRRTAAEELLCHFRIERIEQKDRMRRIEHQIHSLLKSVFLAVEDFEEMTRFLREQKGRLRDRRGKPERRGRRAGRSSTGSLDENYVMHGGPEVPRGRRTASSPTTTPRSARSGSRLS